MRSAVRRYAAGRGVRAGAEGTAVVLVVEGKATVVAGPGYGSQESYPKPNDRPSTAHQLGLPAVTRACGSANRPMSTR